MSKIKDLTPTQGNTGTSAPTQAVNALVHYGDMTNGIPTTAIEPLHSIDDALAFAATIVGQYSILYIEYQGLKLGVNV